MAKDKGKLPRADQETVYYQTAGDRIDGIIRVYSDDPTVIGKLERKGFKGEEVENSFGGKNFVIEGSIGIRKKKTMTPEQRKAASERIRKNVHNQDIDN